jgi:cell division protein FtsQ
MTSSNASDLPTIQAELERDRKLIFRQQICRALFVSSLAGGLCWGFTIPKWEILDSAQIIVEGNRYLPTQTIVSTLQLNYPLSIWDIPTGKLREKIVSLPPIAAARVTRQIFPPTLKVVLQEKIPVAASVVPIETNSQNSLKQDNQKQLGFLDRHGDWLPKNFYQQTTLKLPTLQVKGYRQVDQISWQKLYQAIELSSVKILAVDWTDANNLVLYSQIGKVYLGVSNRDNEINEKMQVLGKMGELPRRISRDRLDYIDLTDPKQPKIKETMKIKQQ